MIEALKSIVKKDPYGVEITTAISFAFGPGGEGAWVLSSEGLGSERTIGKAVGDVYVVAARDVVRVYVTVPHGSVRQSDPTRAAVMAGADELKKIALAKFRETHPNADVYELDDDFRRMPVEK